MALIPRSIEKNISKGFIKSIGSNMVPEARQPVARLIFRWIIDTTPCAHGIFTVPLNRVEFIPWGFSKGE